MTSRLRRVRRQASFGAKVKLRAANITFHESPKRMKEGGKVKVDVVKRKAWQAA